MATSIDPHDHFKSDPDFRYLAQMIEILKIQRHSLGYSERQAGKLAGLPSWTIGRAEQLERIPGLVALRRWARALDVDWLTLCQEAETRSKSDA